MAKKILTAFCFIVILSLSLPGTHSAQTQQPFLTMTIKNPAKMLADAETVSREMEKPVAGDLVWQMLVGKIFPVDKSTLDLSHPLTMILSNPMSMGAGIQNAVVLLAATADMEGTVQSLGDKTEFVDEEKTIYKISREGDAAGTFTYLKKDGNLAMISSSLLLLRDFDPASLPKPPSGIKGNAILQMDLEPVRPMLAMMIPMTQQQAINETRTALQEAGESEEVINQKIAQVEQVFGFAEKLLAALKGLNMGLDMDPRFLSTQFHFPLNPGNMFADLAAKNTGNTVLPYLDYIDSAAPFTIAMNVALTPEIKDFYFNMNQMMMLSMMENMEKDMDEVPEEFSSAFNQLWQQLQENMPKIKESLYAASSAMSVSFQDGRPYIYSVAGGYKDPGLTLDLYRTIVMPFVKTIGLDSFTMAPVPEKVHGVTAEKITLDPDQLIVDLKTMAGEEEAISAEEEQELRAVLQSFFAGQPLECFYGFDDKLTYTALTPDGRAGLERVIQKKAAESKLDAAAFFGPLDPKSQVVLKLNVGDFLTQLKPLLEGCLPPEEISDYIKVQETLKGVLPVYMGKKFYADSVRADIYIPRNLFTLLLGMEDEEEVKQEVEVKDDAEVKE